MIKLYTKDNCVKCRLTRMKLVEQDIDFEEHSIDHEAGVADMLREQGFQSAPVVITDNDAWSGFRPNKIEELA